MKKEIQSKAELAKSGASCIVGFLFLLSFILFFIYWPLAIIALAGALIYASVSSKEATELEKSGEVYLGSNVELLNLSTLSPAAEPFVIIVDVETTGLLVDDTTPTIKKVKENPDWYPRIVQIAWLTLSRNYEIVEKNIFYVKQNEPIPEKAIQIHGITNEICNLKGVEIADVIHKFRESASFCEYYAGHNVHFDKYVIEAECIKNDLPKPFKYLKGYDTMKMGQGIVKRRKFKLEEIANKIFGKKLLQDNNINFHDAFSDVWVTASIFAVLHKNDIKY
jgi:DNA polymerase III epsilon subunit-like protein